MIGITHEHTFLLENKFTRDQFLKAGRTDGDGTSFLFYLSMKFFKEAYGFVSPIKLFTVYENTNGSRIVFMTMEDNTIDMWKDNSTPLSIILGSLYEILLEKIGKRIDN